MPTLAVMDFRSSDVFTYIYYVQDVLARRSSSELLESLLWAGNMLGIYPERQPLHRYTRLDMSLTRDVQVVVPQVKHINFLSG
jgi:hypothetical protein